MIRVFVMCLALLALAILLSNAVLSFLTLDESSVQRAEQDSSQQAKSLSAPDLQGARPLRPSRPSNGGSTNLTAEGVGVETSLSTDVLSAVERQVANRFDDFIDSLAGDDRRREAVKSALTQAYTEAEAASSQTNSLGANPNFVVDALATILNGDELTGLETFLEESSREVFVETYSPQVDLISPQLEAGNKQLMLETLFTETYAATNPNGNTVGQTSGFLEQQLEAIRITRDNIRGSLQGEQLDLANDFLSEQEAGLNKALEIFSPQSQ